MVARLIIIFFALALVAIAMPLIWGCAVYWRHRLARRIICPENGAAAIVKVDALQAATSEVAGPPRLRLCSCSRWPGKQDCAQDCIPQVESAPFVGEPWHAPRWIGSVAALVGGALVAAVIFVPSGDRLTIHVQDISGATLDQAQVTIVPLKGVDTRSALAGGDGTCIFSKLEWGDYEVKIRKPGFETCSTYVFVNGVWPVRRTYRLAAQPAE